MQIQTFSNEEEWLEARLGKITGTRLVDLVVSIPKDEITKELDLLGVPFKKTAKKDELEKLLPIESKDKIVKSLGRKIGYYELIAERIAIPPSTENAMDRGKRLEDYAIERFIKETGKVVSNELVMWTRDDDENIAVSPDGSIGRKGAVECKCLSSARHIEAWLTKKIPSEYQHQKIQYFIVNDELEELFWVFYDPRMPKDFFYFVVKREDVQAEIAEYLALEKQVLAEIAEIEKELTF